MWRSGGEVLVPPLTAWLQPVGQVVGMGIRGTGTNSMAASCRPGSEGGYAVRQLDVDQLRPRLILVGWSPL